MGGDFTPGSFIEEPAGFLVEEPWSYPRRRPGGALFPTLSRRAVGPRGYFGGTAWHRTGCPPSGIRILGRAGSISAGSLGPIVRRDLSPLKNASITVLPVES